MAVYDPPILPVNATLIEPQIATIVCYEIILVECSFGGIDSTTDAWFQEMFAVSLGVEKPGAHFEPTA